MYWLLLTSLMASWLPLQPLLKNSQCPIPHNNNTTVDWDVDAQWGFKSITAYREGSTDTNIDFDSTVNPVLLVPAYYDDDQTTQEFQLTYSDDRLNFIGGLYFYSISHVKQYIQLCHFIYVIYVCSVSFPL